jgi:DNA-3-methyladenine glycosylase II
MTDLTPYERLAAIDDVLAEILRRHGAADPFHWPGADPAGASNFAALALHITSQQISTTAALSIFHRLEEATGGLPTAQAITELGQARLRECGLSGAKTASLLDLARLHATGVVDIDRLDGLDDAQVIAALTTIRGVGLWTAQMFLIHQLHRSDVLPAGDLGIRRAVQLGWSYGDVPSIDAVTDLGLRWAPYRTYAASLLWASLRPSTTVPA